MATLGRMPELPEVERVRAGLEPKVVGRRLEQVDISDARLTRPFDPAEVAAELQGERVAALDRRGKYLVGRFESGRVLLIHLRMTGQLLHTNGGSPQADDRHRRAVVRLDDGSDVIYRDMRRFGTWLLIEPGELGQYLDARVGGDPLAQAFTSKRLAEALAGRRTPGQAAVLDQRRLAGRGDISAHQGAWGRRLDPLTPG